MSFIILLSSKAVATVLKKEDFPAPVSPIIMILINGTSDVAESKQSLKRLRCLVTTYIIREAFFIRFYIMNVAIKNITVLKDKKEMYVCCVKIKKILHRHLT